MKRKLVLIFLALSILVFFSSSAFITPYLQVQLLSSGYVKDKGVTFKFLLTGDIHPRDIKGVVVINKKNIKLHCNFPGKGPSSITMTCTAFKGTAAKYSGESGIVILAGQPFWFRVPANP